MSFIQPPVANLRMCAAIVNPYARGADYCGNHSQESREAFNFWCTVTSGVRDCLASRYSHYCREMLLCGDDEVYDRGCVSAHAGLFFPGPWVGKNRALNFLFSENIEGRLPSQKLPTFVPGDDCVFSGRNIA